MAMASWRADWAKQKQAIALDLSRGKYGGSYGEAALIFGAVISALAAEVWPGQGIDRKRFVQVLKDFAPRDSDPARISVPLLAGYLRGKGRLAESNRIVCAFMKYCSTRVLTGDEVDRCEEEILSVCSTLTLKELRACSYANLLYRELRSSYVHEYRPGERADSWPMTRSEASVSYVNWANDPDRHIHFHVDWLGDLAVKTAEALDTLASPDPLALPAV